MRSKIRRNHPEMDKVVEWIKYEYWNKYKKDITYPEAQRRAAKLIKKTRQNAKKILK